MIALFAHLLFAAILSVSMVSHKPEKQQGELKQCQMSKKQ